MFSNQGSGRSANKTAAMYPASVMPAARSMTARGRGTDSRQVFLAEFKDALLGMPAQGRHSQFFRYAKYRRRRCGCNLPLLQNCRWSR